MPGAGRAAASPFVHAPLASRLLERLAMNKTCVVVADAGLARFYDVEETEAPRMKVKLVERTVLTNPDLGTLGRSVTGRPRTEANTNREAGPKHPIGEQRERHRIELNRRFGAEIIRQAEEITRAWKRGALILIAEPQLLGLIRESMRKALHQGIELKELAKDYTHLAPAELHDRLALDGIAPARRD